MIEVSINVDDISKEIERSIKEYTEDVKAGIEQAKIEVAKKAVKELKQTSPRRTKGKDSYADGWARKKSKGAQIIYNKNKPSLTHLLEKGHAKRNGGRVNGIPHIEPAEQKANDEFQNRVEWVIKNGN